MGKEVAAALLIFLSHYTLDKDGPYGVSYLVQKDVSPLLFLTNAQEFSHMESGERERAREFEFEYLSLRSSLLECRAGG